MAITQNLRKFARKFKGFHPEAHFEVFLDAIGAEKLVVCDEDDPWGPTITRYCKLLCGFVIRAGLVQNKLHKKTKNGPVINKEAFTADALNFVLVLLEPMLYVKPKGIDAEKVAGIVEEADQLSLNFLLDLLLEKATRIVPDSMYCARTFHYVKNTEEVQWKIDILESAYTWARNYYGPAFNMKLFVNAYAYAWIHLYREGDDPLLELLKRAYEGDLKL